MILPTKFIREEDSLLGVSAILLTMIDKKKNLSTLWEESKKIKTIGTYERFILGLDLLYMFGLIDTSNDKIIRVGV